MKKTEINIEQYNPLNDFLLSKYMNKRGCEEIVLSFLNAILNEYDKKINSVEILENDIQKSQLIKGEHCIICLIAITENNERLIIEIVQRNSNDLLKLVSDIFIHEYSNRPKILKEYGHSPDILINIADFSFLEESEWHSIYHITKEPESEDDVLTIYLMDIIKFKNEKKLNLKNELNQWAIFFSNNEFPNEFKQVLELNDAIKSAHEKIKEILSGAEESELYGIIEQKEQEINQEIKKMLGM